MPSAPHNIEHVLLDVNVCIDLIVNRTILPETKKRLFAVFIRNGIEPYVPAFSIDTIFYILNSSMKINKQAARDAIWKLIKYSRLLHTTDESVHQAFSSGFPDFEDGFINSLAETSGMDAIITNNISDFTLSTLPVYHPDDFIALYSDGF